jgi:hypothetical protein
MLTDDAIETALIAALAPFLDPRGTGSVERKDTGHLELRDGDVRLGFYFAAQLNEIQLSVAIATPAGPERLPLDDVVKWLGEPVRAHMFNDTNLDAVCRRVADFSYRVIERYERNPDAATREIDAIARHRARVFEIGEVRREAERAWTGRDFAEAERLYAAIADHLTAGEKKRLDFARRHTPSGTAAH